MIPTGALLNLRSGEWHHIHDLLGDVYCDVKVFKVHTTIVKEDGGFRWVWVTGHGIECSWDSSDCARPCIEVYVREEVLARHG